MPGSFAVLDNRLSNPESQMAPDEMKTCMLAKKTKAVAHQEENPSVRTEEDSVASLLITAPNSLQKSKSPALADGQAKELEVEATQVCMICHHHF